jgi:hypothetical protein
MYLLTKTLIFALVTAFDWVSRMLDLGVRAIVGLYGPAVTVASEYQHWLQHPAADWIIICVVFATVYAFVRRRRVLGLVGQAKAYTQASIGKMVMAIHDGQITPALETPSGERVIIPPEGWSTLSLAASGLERANPENPPKSHRHPGYVFSLCEPDGSHIGMAARVGNGFVTCHHVWTAWLDSVEREEPETLRERLFQKKAPPALFCSSGKTFPVEASECVMECGPVSPEGALDLVLIKVSTSNPWSVLAIKSGKLGSFRPGVYAAVYGFGPSGELKSTSAMARDESRPFGLIHRASTETGWSGSPIIQGGQIVGVHTGYNPRSTHLENRGVSVALLLRRGEESDVRQHGFREMEDLPEFVGDLRLTYRKGKFKKGDKVHEYTEYGGNFTLDAGDYASTWADEMDAQDQYWGSGDDYYGYDDGREAEAAEDKRAEPAILIREAQALRRGAAKLVPGKDAERASSEVRIPLRFAATQARESQDFGKGPESGPEPETDSQPSANTSGGKNQENRQPTSSSSTAEPAHAKQDGPNKGKSRAAKKRLKKKLKNSAASTGQEPVRLQSDNL